MSLLNQQIGQRISEIRKARHLTQEQLGEKLGISAQAVSKWEKGESLPDICLLPDISKELGLSIDTLLSIPATDSRERLVSRLSESLENWDLDFMWDAWSAMFTGAASAQNGLWEEGINGVVTNKKIAILDGLGFGAILAKDYVSRLKEINIEDAAKLCLLLSDKENIQILFCLDPVIKSSVDELEESLMLSKDELKERLYKLMTYRFIELDEEGYRLNPQTWPTLLLIMSGAFVWCGMRKRASSWYANFEPEDK